MVQFDARFRGSDRLAAGTRSGEESDKFFCLELSDGWGLTNRLQTTVLMSTFCSYHRYGLYILWHEITACPGSFNVLDWLHESHCEEIYNICSSAILKGGRHGGPRVADFVKNVLLEQWMLN